METNKDFGWKKTDSNGAVTYNARFFGKDVALYKTGKNWFMDFDGETTALKGVQEHLEAIIFG